MDSPLIINCMIPTIWNYIQRYGNSKVIPILFINALKNKNENKLKLVKMKKNFGLNPSKTIKFQKIELLKMPCIWFCKYRLVLISGPNFLLFLTVCSFARIGWLWFQGPSKSDLLLFLWSGLLLGFERNQVLQEWL